MRDQLTAVRVVVDLNAVPPSGVAGLEPSDCGVDRDGAACYGAIGVGGWKMKIHKAAIRRLFETNDRVFDIEAVYALGCALIPPGS
ncbi:MAG TPA: hypothetical protein EYP14_04110 [Planctomycetaceae bacterium]|nr:hypothetical protein [Planctomycetaceae bacterium]